MPARPRFMLLAAMIITAAVPASGRAAGEPAPAGDELSAQDKEVLASATQLAGEISQIMERWIVAKAITEEKLFSRLYYPMAGTDPIKYGTDYDALADRDFVAPQEKVLARSAAYVFVVVTDVNGYLPTHNQRYSQPLTGNHAVDLVNNRTKRIFGDRTGFGAARNEAPYLLQRYKRDTGEQMADLSVPIMVRGKHFGCVRVGYKREER
jgi:hypothetical protein